MNKTHEKLTLIGVGNRFRGDDAVGLEIVRQLKKKYLSDVQFIELSGEGASLIEVLQERDAVFIFDAVHSGAQPGTIFHFDATKERIPNHFFNYSTHAFGVAEAIEMARTLNRLPRRLILYGIEGKYFEYGLAFSGEVKNAITDVIKAALNEIRSYTRADSTIH